MTLGQAERPGELVNISIRIQLRECIVKSILSETVVEVTRGGSSASVDSWSGRGDLNSRPPAPKAGGPLKTTLPFSALLLKTNNLAESVACRWLCPAVPICLQGGHKSRHIRASRKLE